MKTMWIAAAAGTLGLGIISGAQAQTVTSTNGVYSVTFTEQTTNVGGSAPFLYTYTGRLNQPTNGAFVNSLNFVFANPNAINPATAFSDSFAIVNETPNSIAFATDATDPGFTAANPVAVFTFQSAFAPTTSPTALAITPSGGNNTSPGPGVGNLFVGPAPVPEPAAWATLGLGAFGLLALTARARRKSLAS